MKLSFWVGALALLLGACASTEQVNLAPCEIPSEAGGPSLSARCGVLAVAEDAAHPELRMIDLRIVVVPAASPERARDPIFYFEGGPGGSAVESARPVSEIVLPVALRERDLVFVEQRGTGQSNPLLCPPDPRTDLAHLLRPGLDAYAKARCIATIQAAADPRFYGTSQAADDVEMARRALGYDQINLVGLSYGARLALVYMGRYGDHVRAAALVSVDHPDIRAPLDTAPDTEAALRGVIAACAANRDCDSAYPDFESDLARADARLRGGPVSVTIENPITHQEEAGEVTRDLFATGVRGLLYQTEGYVQLPGLIHGAAEGDYTPFASSYANAQAAGGGGYRGLFYTITCAEDLDFADLADARRRAEGTFYADVRIRIFEEVCDGWPRSYVPLDFMAPVRYAGPVLLFSGAIDPETPARHAEAVARTLPQARHIVFARDGHTIGASWPGCAADLLAAFYQAADASALDARCADSVAQPDWQLPD